MPSRPAPPPGQKPSFLKDPCGDRPVKDHPPPPSECLMGDTFWNAKGHPDLNLLMEHLGAEGVLSQELLLEIIKKASEIFEGEPNLLKLNDPITVVGDIHGQFFDLLKLLEVGGTPGDTQYIFLGDFVDRGSFSVEVVALLFSIKIRHPKRLRMLRGNHECRQMTAFFNFREECEYKYNGTVYNAVMDAFDTLPLAATINGKFLCVHGGISPELPNLKAINSVSRFMEPPREGLICDLLWADPLEAREGRPVTSSKKHAPPFVHNDVRGCSYFYSFEGANKFLHKNSMLSIIRAHEVQIEGYKMHQTNPNTGFPTVITIFSAPNYCDVYNNKAAILKFDNSTLNILQFNCSPHPYHLPNFMDVFSWSLPFVIEKITEMLYYILQPAGGKAIDDDLIPSLPPVVNSSYRASLSVDQNKTLELMQQLSMASQGSTSSGPLGEIDETNEARDRMRKKVRTIAKMARMFKTKRQENETVLRLDGACPADRMAPGLLLAGKDKLVNEMDMFNHVANVDTTNEMRPDKVGSEAVPVIDAGRDFAPDDMDDAHKA